MHDLVQRCYRARKLELTELRQVLTTAGLSKDERTLWSAIVQARAMEVKALQAYLDAAKPGA